ncbi:steroid dehydrogenase [Penicillium chermesinum]|uniref:Steroid dehydrogenase n=1 Tax=Penicillium chermesinum TaxID=63820 RepID=A0A9W9NT55_9EURO|nr:steroid dehydrogenase [Penicillium chermesinum]KAJ5225667.1 steroid dehydrogenase [Penicillium chermesinum]
MGTTWSQFFPPSPALTEVNLPSQRQKVFIVTGGYSGMGLELSTFLYQKSARKQSGRSKPRIPREGELVFLPLALDDLSTIKPAVEIFTAAESRLDVLFNNAGVSNPQIRAQTNF